MYCPYCGKPIDDGIPYCPWCGGGLREDTSSPIPDSVFADGHGPAPTAPAEAEGDTPTAETRPATQHISSPKAVPLRRGSSRGGSSRRGTPRYSDDPDNSGAGRLLMGLAIAACALAAVFLVWTRGCSRLSPAPVEPAPAEQEAVEPEAQESQAEAEAPEDEPAEQEATEADKVKASLAEYTWEELSAISAKISAAPNRDEAIAIARSYNLVDAAGTPTGDTIAVTLSDGSTLRVFLADVYHDDLVGGGKAGLTFLSWNLPLSHRMNADDTNMGGWASSEMRSWLANTALGMLPNDLHTAIRPVIKMTNNTGNTHDTTSVTMTEDSLWIPSVNEVAGDVSWVWSSDADNSGGYNAVLNAEGDQYAVFASAVTETDGPNAALALRGDGSSSWWLRTSSASVTSNYRYVTEDGNPSGFGNASGERGDSIGFCL